MLSCYCLCVITASRATQKSTNDEDEGEVVSKTKSNYSNVICYYCLCVITASRATRTKKKSTNDIDEEDISKTKSNYSTL